MGHLVSDQNWTLSTRGEINLRADGKAVLKLALQNVQTNKVGSAATVRAYEALIGNENRMSPFSLCTHRHSPDGFKPPQQNVSSWSCTDCICLETNLVNTWMK